MFDPRIEHLFTMLNELEKTVDAGSKASDENNVDKEFDLSVQMLTQVTELREEFERLSKVDELFGSFTLTKVQEAVKRIEMKIARNVKFLLAQSCQPKAKA